MRLRLNFTCLLFGIAFIANSQTVTTVAGNGLAGFSGDGGSANAAQLNYPGAVAFDAIGNLYIADYDNNRIRKVNTSGIITTVVGVGTSGYSGDGGLAINAELNTPLGVAFDAAGNMYISDTWNNIIRKVNTSGIISTVAGVGTPSFSGDGGSAIAAELNHPYAVTFDGMGNMYIADVLNHRIRKVNSVGTITTVAGNGISGFSGDGGLAISAQLSGPYGVTSDFAGNLYISDNLNNRIRKVNTSGIISTFAGSATGGFSGDGGPATSAQLGRPFGVVFDPSGNMYIVDYWNNRIRKVNPSGIITCIAGILGPPGYGGDGGLATAAQFYLPTGIALDATGNLYVADQTNHRIRKINNVVTSMETESIQNSGLFIYPNPSSNTLNIESKQEEFENSELEITNTVGQTVLKEKFKTKIDVSKLPQGFYNLKIISESKQVYYSKFIKE